MKRTLIILLLIVNSSFAQQSCKTPTLGQLFEKLKNLKQSKQNERELLNYESFGDFDFVTFKPVNMSIDSSSVMVGRNGAGLIKELIFNKRGEIYCLAVHDFEQFRILLLKLPNVSGGYSFTPTAIYNSKVADENYMIHVKPQFKNDYEYIDLFEKFPLGKLTEISCVMHLDKQLYPFDMVKFSNSRVAYYSSLQYEYAGSRRLAREVMFFFVDWEHYFPKLKIDAKSCLNEFMDSMGFSKTESNLIVVSEPAVFKRTYAPIWIYSGAHRYQLP